MCCKLNLSAVCERCVLYAVKQWSVPCALTFTSGRYYCLDVVTLFAMHAQRSSYLIQISCVVQSVDLCTNCARESKVYRAMLRSRLVGTFLKWHRSFVSSASVVIRNRRSDGLTIGTQIVLEHQKLLLFTGTTLAVLIIKFLLKLHSLFTIHQITFKLQSLVNTLW